MKMSAILVIGRNSCKLATLVREMRVAPASAIADDLVWASNVGAAIPELDTHSGCGDAALHHIQLQLAGVARRQLCQLGAGLAVRVWRALGDLLGQERANKTRVKYNNAFLESWSLRPSFRFDKYGITLLYVVYDHTIFITTIDIDPPPSGGSVKNLPITKEARDIDTLVMATSNIRIPSFDGDGGAQIIPDFAPRFPLAPWEDRIGYTSVGEGAVLVSGGAAPSMFIAGEGLTATGGGAAIFVLNTGSAALGTGSGVDFVGQTAADSGASGTILASGGSGKVACGQRAGSDNLVTVSGLGTGTVSHVWADAGGYHALGIGGSGPYIGDNVIVVTAAGLAAASAGCGGGDVGPCWAALGSEAGGRSSSPMGAGGIAAAMATLGASSDGLAVGVETGCVFGSTWSSTKFASGGSGQTTSGGSGISMADGWDSDALDTGGTAVVSGAFGVGCVNQVLAGRAYAFVKASFSDTIVGGAGMVTTGDGVVAFGAPDSCADYAVMGRSVVLVFGATAPRTIVARGSTVIWDRFDASLLIINCASSIYDSVLFDYRHGADLADFYGVDLATGGDALINGYDADSGPGKCSGGLESALTKLRSINRRESAPGLL